jgi:glycosyltransferase involved in cell wall biosynthesis
MRIHFVYAFSPHDQQLQSPFCITRNLYHYLVQRADVVYHTWDSKKTPNLKPDDILLGHPHYDTNTLMQQVFRKNLRCKARCTIHPLHTVRVGDNMPFDFMAKQADKIFSICGPYWYDTIHTTQFSHWKPKIVRLDMAVDGNQFPFLREKFHSPGKRRFVYIGSAMPQKNLGYMTQLVASMPGIQLDWYGGDSNHPLAKLPNVRTFGWITLDRQRAQQIVNDCDIMINTSISDANPTTLLESRAWGLITACTPQSGYYNDPYFTELKLDDIGYSRQALQCLNETPSDVLMKRAKDSRKEIEERYTWENFCDTVWSELQSL